MFKILARSQLSALGSPQCLCQILGFLLRRSQVCFITHPFQLTAYNDFAGGSEDCIITHPFQLTDYNDP